MHGRWGQRSALQLGLVLLCAQGAAMATTDCGPEDRSLDKKPAEQKILLLERMTTDSVPARRVAESGSEEAKLLLGKARIVGSDARSAFEQGCFTRASTLAAAGLGTASAAFRSGSETNAAGANTYEDLRRRVASLLDTTEKQDAELSGVSAEEVAGMYRQLARAEQLAAQGQYAEAAPLLAPIADRLERRLIDMFDNKTLVYAKDFASPADKYAYLVEYYRGYRLLLDGHAARGEQALAGLLKSAEESFVDAERAATQSQWEGAIPAMQQAIELCARAARISGIYY
jgi:hypothetical protein